MTREKMLKELDRLREAIDKPDPDLRDVMAKLDDISSRLDALERRPLAPALPVPYPMPYPVRPWPQHYYGTLTSGSSSTSIQTNLQGFGDSDAGMVIQ